jgi:hypothetical protein
MIARNVFGGRRTRKLAGGLLSSESRLASSAIVEAKSGVGKERR